MLEGEKKVLKEKARYINSIMPIKSKFKIFNHMYAHTYIGICIHIEIYIHTQKKNLPIVDLNVCHQNFCHYLCNTYEKSRPPCKDAPINS